MKILVVALAGIGDALMFTPALELAKKEFPDAMFDALVMSKGSEDIFRRLPQFSKVLRFDFLSEGLIRSLKYIYKLRGQYDYSINVYPANRKEYNIIQYLIGAKHRAGVRYNRMDKNSLGFLNTVRIPEDDALHNVEENILQMQSLLSFSAPERPALNFPLFEEDEFAAESFIAVNNIRRDVPYVGFHAGCSPLKNHTKRRWDPDNFIELGKKLITESNVNILIFGGPEENELKTEIKEGINSSNCFVTDMKNLGESAALIQKCDVFVTNDSSLMHVASAMQRKVVAVIGPTNSAYIHPWKTDYKIVSLHLECSPCFFYSPKHLACTRTDTEFKCIREISIDMVSGAVHEYLDQGN